MTEPLQVSQAVSPPVELASMADWFESLSYGLVLLVPYPLDNLRAAVRAFERAMARHSVEWDSKHARAASEAPSRNPLARVVESDHTWFSTSFEQLRWFLGIVENEDHGGHRQALGQYGRLVSEAVRRHLDDERRLLAPSVPAKKG